MTAKEYLSQAWLIDREICAKLEQVRRSRELAAHVSTTLSKTPVSGTHDVHGTENAIAQFVDLEAEIGDGIARLTLLKREITAAIDSVSDAAQRMLLRLRYLSFKSWSEIASELGYSKQHTFRLHSVALEAVTIPKVASK